MHPLAPSDPAGVEAHRAALKGGGFVHIAGRFRTKADAFVVAQALVEQLADMRGDALSVIGDFVIPPPDATETRDFQTLHFDFGLPIEPKLKRDVALYTALYIGCDARLTSALTRLVPIAPLLKQRTWPAHRELVGRLVGYGKTHGAWADAEGYHEGSFARIIEAAVGTEPSLPSVKTTPGFLCGMEFDSLDAETRFLHSLGLCVEDVQVDATLRPGDLLVFDNLRLVHGRSGTRQPGELHQRVFGFKDLSANDQLALRNRVLAAFGDHGGAGTPSAP